MDRSIIRVGNRLRWCTKTMTSGAVFLARQAFDCDFCAWRPPKVPFWKEISRLDKGTQILHGLAWLGREQRDVHANDRFSKTRTILATDLCQTTLWSVTISLVDRLQ